MTVTMAPPVISLTALVQDYFQRYLPIERNLSRNTILSYRDALKLLLRFLSRTKDRSPDEFTCEDVLDVEPVRAFLRWLVEERRCALSTCNQRLAALKSFARFVAWRAPEHLDRCRRIREIRRARTEKREVEYLEGAEVRQLVQAPDPVNLAGLRDRALLLLLYNTGARVQEVCDLDVGDLRLDTAPCARLLGKGRKERTCPLWAKTVAALQAWLRARGTPADDAPLFLNARGRRLSRSGVAYLLTRAGRRAGLQRLDRARRLTPHVLRHTTAMHMLRAGVCLSVLASWLGHAQLSTTHEYVTADDRMKQEALAAANVLPELSGGAFPPPDVITWLEQLGRRARYVDSSPPESALWRPTKRRSP